MTEHEFIKQTFIDKSNEELLHLYNEAMNTIHSSNEAKTSFAISTILEERGYAKFNRESGEMEVQ